MRIRTLLTTAAVSTALVAGGIAGPALAANPDVVVQPVITLSSAGFTAPALTATLPLSINTTAGGAGYMNLWLLTSDGAVTDGGSIFQDDAGNATIDIAAVFSAKLGNYKPMTPGNYGLYVTSAETYGYSPDYSTRTVFLAAQSASLPFSITKLQSKITGFKTKSKSANYGKLIKISSPTVYNVGPDNKIVFQYKKKGAKKWKTSEVVPTYSTFPAKQKLKTKAFNLIDGKKAKRGTYYFRFLIKGSAYTEQSATKQIKLTWK